jgi:hypothetical protein
MNNVMLWVKTKNSTYEIFKCDVVDGSSFYALLSVDSNAFNDEKNKSLRADFVRLDDKTIIDDKLSFIGVSYYNCRLELNNSDPENPIYRMERKDEDSDIITAVIDKKIETSSIEGFSIVNKEQTSDMIESGNLVITDGAYKKFGIKPLKVSAS